MRIVAGKYRSRKLNSVTGLNTRPTADRIKEAIYSSLGTYFDGGWMLDLFAGSGNMGLEGLSRGMSRVVFVDKDKEAIRIIKENVANLKVESECEIWKLDYQDALEKCKTDGYKFRLIYLDPPYAYDEFEKIMLWIEENELLDYNGVVVVENRKEDEYRIDYQELETYKEACYGIAKIRYFRRKEK